MAMNTVILHNNQIRMADPNWLFKILQRKRFGMMPAVVEFDPILSRKCMRHMAVVAGSGRVMTRLNPGIIMVFHYVIIHAGTGIITEIGICIRFNIGLTSKS